MDSPKITYKYYSNPAFCAQSEVVYTQQTPCVTPLVIDSSSSKGSGSSIQKRVPPLGANSPKRLVAHREFKTANHRVKTDISDNPLRNVGGSSKYANVSQKICGETPPKPGPKPSRNNSIYSSKRIKGGNNRTQEETLEMRTVSSKQSEDEAEEDAPSLKGRPLKHRYAEIPNDYDDEYSPSKKRIIETEPEEYSVDEPSEDEGKSVPTEIVRSVNGKVHRYAIIPSDDEEGIVVNFDERPTNETHDSPPTFHLRSPGMPRKQIEATQKLHEFLSTPKKTPTRKLIAIGSPIKPCSSSPSLRSQQNAYVLKSPTRDNTPRILMSSTPKQNIASSRSYADITSPKLPRRNTSISPRAQQKLSYENTSPIKHNYSKDGNGELNRSFDFKDKEHLFMARSTAIISPRLADRTNESIYSDGYARSKWKPTPGCATLLLAAIMLALSGGLSAALSFYLMYMFGRHYFLEVGVISGFTCFILGLLGFRSRTDHLLPNRNFISGYIVMSVFSLLSCGALLTLLYLGPDWGNGSLQGAVGGVVTALGALCLLLSVIGFVASFCCGNPPPDNRVSSIRHL